MPKESGKNEQDLIKKALSIDLEETTVDIFREDLFGEKSREQKPQEKAPLKEPAPQGQEPGEAEQKPTRETPVQEPAPQKAPEEEKADAVEENLGLELEDIDIKAGELQSLAVAREEEKLDQTRKALAQLEKMGEDFMSTEELKKLFQNVNLIIDLLHQAVARLERLEQKLKEMGLLPDL